MKKRRDLRVRQSHQRRKQVSCGRKEVEAQGGWYMIELGPMRGGRMETWMHRSDIIA